RPTHRHRSRTQAHLPPGADHPLMLGGRSLPSMEDTPIGTPVGRRVFFGMLGLGAAGVVFGARAQDWMERVLAPLTARDGTGLSTFLPVGRFRIYTVTNELPHKSEADYRLRVGGAVPTPLVLTAADLRAMTPTNLTKDFQCVTGWRVHDVAWSGVRL